MKTKTFTPQQRNEMYERQEVISNRMQWVAIITILTAIAIIAYSLELKNGLITM